MLELIFTAFLLITLIMCFVNIRQGVAMYLLYSILVPFLSFFSFGKNFVPFFILIALIYNYGVKNVYFKPLLPFIFLYISQLFLIPFHNEVAFGYQLNYLRSDIMSTLILPFVIVNVMKKDPKAFYLFSKILLVTICIAVAYSLYLIINPGINPYLTVILPLSGGEFNEAYASAENAGRVFGRISGIFGHPMTNGIFLCLAVIYIVHRLFSSLIKMKKIFYSLLLLMLLSAILTIGVRTAISASFIGLVSFILLERKFNLLLFFLIGSGVMLLVVTQIPGLENFISSIIDPGKSNEVGGSSVEMRLHQFEGAINEIKYNPLFGHGAGWTYQYKELYGIHPVLLAFESLLFVLLCNNGVIGVIAWLIMLVLYITNVKRNFESKHSNLLLSLMAVYVSYSLITGEYGYMKYFLIFYSLLWVDGKIRYRIKINILKRVAKIRNHKLKIHTLFE